MNFAPDAVVQLIAAPIDDVSDGVRAMQVICTSDNANEKLLPPRDVMLAYHKAWTMTQFIQTMKAVESMMLIRQGWYENAWNEQSQELLVCSVSHHPEGGFVFKLQSKHQYLYDLENNGSRIDFCSLEVTSVGISRIAFGAFHEYCRNQYGGDLMSNDPSGGVREYYDE